MIVLAPINAPRGLDLSSESLGLACIGACLLVCAAICLVFIFLVPGSSRSDAPTSSRGKAKEPSRPF